MQRSIGNIPADLGAALQKKAAAEGKSVDDVAIELLRSALEQSAGAKKRDLSDLAGTWVEDPEFDKALDEQDQIDPDLWK